MEKGLLVYLPEYTGNDPDELDRRGLAALREPGIHELMMPVHRGPDGGHGTLVIFDNPARPDIASDHAYDAEHQQWKPAPPDDGRVAGRYWLGYTKDAPPGPDALARRVTFDGEPVILRDGKPWIIPIADYLPKVLTVNPDTGLDDERPAPEHDEFVKWSNALFDLFMSHAFLLDIEENKQVKIPGGFRYAAAALAKNYRVNRDVADLLMLVGGYEAFDIAKVGTGTTLLTPLVQEKKSAEPCGQPVAAS